MDGIVVVVGRGDEGEGRREIFFIKKNRGQGAEPLVGVPLPGQQAGRGRGGSAPRETIVAKGGRYDSILFSHNSTLALLTYLCVIELLHFGDIDVVDIESVSNHELADAVGTSVCENELNPSIEEGEMMCLREVISERGDIFEALCENIVKQTVHLDAMNESLKEGDEDRALSHIQFLRFDCGVDEADYMYA
nr:hypothetical protein [Tanacetum cinerariifolium]